MLCHRIGGRGRRCHLDDLWIADKLVAQLLDIVGQGCREKQGLAQGRQQTDNALNIGNETHIQHPVRFVDDEYLDVSQQHLAALEMVQKAPRGGNQHINTLAECNILVGKANAAD